MRTGKYSFTKKAPIITLLFVTNPRVLPASQHLADAASAKNTFV